MIIVAIAVGGNRSMKNIDDYKKVTPYDIWNIGSTKVSYFAEANVNGMIVDFLKMR